MPKLIRVYGQPGTVVALKQLCRTEDFDRLLKAGQLCQPSAQRWLENPYGPEDTASFEENGAFAMHLTNNHSLAYIAVAKKWLELEPRDRALYLLHELAHERVSHDQAFTLYATHCVYWQKDVFALGDRGLMWRLLQEIFNCRIEVEVELMTFQLMPQAAALRLKREAEQQVANCRQKLRAHYEGQKFFVPQVLVETLSQQYWFCQMGRAYGARDKLAKELADSAASWSELLRQTICGRFINEQQASPAIADWLNCNDPADNLLRLHYVLKQLWGFVISKRKKTAS